MIKHAIIQTKYGYYKIIYIYIYICIPIQIPNKLLVYVANSAEALQYAILYFAGFDVLEIQ